MKNLIVRSIDGDTIDKICLRYFGVTGEITEHVLEMNRHISAIGPVLPINTEVVLPANFKAGGQDFGTKLWD